MSLKEISPEKASPSEQTVEYLTQKYLLNRSVVIKEINNLRAKLDEDDGSWPRKTKRRIKTLERLEKSAAYVHSVERRVEAALMRNHI